LIYIIIAIVLRSVYEKDVGYGYDD